MDLHANAVLDRSPASARLCDLVAAGVTITAAALVVGCSRQTASKWVNRRVAVSRSRSLEPAAALAQAHARALEQAILRARAELREGPHVIGWALGVAASTVHAVLRRHGRSRLVAPAAARGDRPLRARAAGRARARRHQEARPDRASPAIASPVTAAAQAKGKAGWQYLFVAIDDHSRLGFAARLPRRDRRLSARLPRRARPLLRPRTASPSSAC